MENIENIPEELKNPQTIDEINKAYSMLAGVLGDKLYRQKILEGDIGNLFSAMAVLDKKAKDLKDNGSH